MLETRVLDEVGVEVMDGLAVFYYLIGEISDFDHHFGVWACICCVRVVVIVVRVVRVLLRLVVRVRA